MNNTQAAGFPPTTRFPHKPLLPQAPAPAPRAVHTASLSSSAAYLPYIQHRGKFITAGDLYGQQQRILLRSRNWGYEPYYDPGQGVNMAPNGHQHPGDAGPGAQSPSRLPRPANGSGLEAGGTGSPNEARDRTQSPPTAGHAPAIASQSAPSAVAVPSSGTPIALQSEQPQSAFPDQGVQSTTGTVVPGQSVQSTTGNAVPGQDTQSTGGPGLSVQSTVPGQGAPHSGVPTTAPGTRHTIPAQHPVAGQNGSPLILHRPNNQYAGNTAYYPGFPGPSGAAYTGTGFSGNYPGPTYTPTSAYSAYGYSYGYGKRADYSRIGSVQNFYPFPADPYIPNSRTPPIYQNSSSQSFAPPANELPLHFQDYHNCADAILLVEKLADLGKKDGAVKVQMNPHFQAVYHAYTAHLNPETFLFKANRLVNNPRRNELHDRLEFYNVLLKFYAELREEEGEKGDSDKREAKRDDELKSEKEPKKELSTENQSKDEESSTKDTAERSSIPEDPAQKETSPEGLSQKETSLKEPAGRLQADSMVDSMKPTEETSKIEPTEDPSKANAVSISPASGIDSVSNEVASENNAIATKSATPEVTEKSISQTSSESNHISKVEKSVKKEETPDENPEKNTRKKPLPISLAKFPMMDKRPLDLYDLFRLVVRKGGFSEVISKKLWAQVGRELGYKGKITSSLSSSLKLCYAKLLHPLELHLGEKALPLVFSSLKAKEERARRESDTAEDSPNQNTKRELKTEESGSKKRKLNLATPLVLGSSEEYQRSIRLKSAKGFLLNDPHLMDLKTPLVISSKDQKSEKPEKEKLITPTGAQAQVKNYVKWLAAYLPVFQDSSRLECSSKLATSCSLRQYLEKDSEFQDYVIAKYPYLFENRFENPERRVNGISISTIDEDKLELLFWQFLKEEQDYGKIENCSKLRHSGGFLGQEESFDILKNRLYELSENQYQNPNYSRPQFQDSLNTFSLKHLPFLPNSIFGAFSANDMDNPSILRPHLNVQMTFSIQNWHCEEHFTQSSSYLFFGKPKRWFFIPEAEFPKFELLLEEVITESSGRVNKNYCSEDWNISSLMEMMTRDEESVSTQFECLMNSLENTVNIYPELRLQHENTEFQRLIDRHKKAPQMNQELLITPELLRERGIKFTTTLQKPGEMIYRYPKTYACSISLGFNISEEVNFASKLWLDYGLEGEKWLQKQGVLPNFSFFKLLVNFAQLHESGERISYYSSSIYADVKKIFSKVADNELAMRSKIRENFKMREVLVEEKSDSDFIADDNLENCFPSKVIITYNSDKFICSPESLLNVEFLDLLQKPGYSAELHLQYSDEKLRFFQRSLNAYSVDFEAWTADYNAMMQRDEDLTLKNYRLTLAEGQKILGALSGAKDVFGQTNNLSPEKEQRFQEFKDQVHTLEKFVEDSSEIVEQCQNILALKHQQRIRGSNENLSDQDDQHLENLVALANKIPRLNFFTPEFDQILEYKNEILNFDRACRQVLNSSEKSVKELDNMISLGESFGMKLPSLMFLKRLKDILLWKGTYDIILGGGDPFLTKKDIFLLPDLKEFHRHGMEILPQSAAEQAHNIRNLISFGDSYDDDVNKFLKQNCNLSTLDLKKVENMMEDMEERLKLKGPSRLLVNLGTYQRLVDLRSQEKLIVFLQTYLQCGYTLSDARVILGELQEAEALREYEYPREQIMAQIQESEAWLSEAEGLIQVEAKANETVPKSACNSQLYKALKALQGKVALSLSDFETDNFEQSSPYLYLKELAGEEEIGEPLRYCHCRGLEDGTMIECDRCHEWYHVNCIDEKKIGKEEESYFCPGCLFIESTTPGSGFYDLILSPVILIPEENLHELILAGQALKFRPAAELGLLEAIVDLMENGRKLTYCEIDTEAAKLVYKMFVFRKFYGCSVSSNTMIENLLGDLKTDPFAMVEKDSLSHKVHAEIQQEVHQEQLEELEIRQEAKQERFQQDVKLQEIQAEMKQEVERQEVQEPHQDIQVQAPLEILKPLETLQVSSAAENSAQNGFSAADAETQKPIEYDQVGSRPPQYPAGHNHISSEISGLTSAVPMPAPTTPAASAVPAENSPVPAEFSSVQAPAEKSEIQFADPDVEKSNGVAKSDVPAEHSPVEQFSEPQVQSLESPVAEYPISSELPSKKSPE